MATLIAANYQSTTVTSYGGMFISCGTLKANTLYTLKCRYKYTKNTSSMPQILCYNSNWSYGGGIYDTTDDGVMKTRITTFTSYPSAINYSIGCYAWSYNDQTNGGGKTGVLEVDWYELWEGDAREFSLADAIALSGYSGVNDFLTIQGTTDKPLKNPNYFSSSEEKNALRSWIGYYYKTHSSTSYGDWAYTYNHYTSASRSRTVTTYDHYSNGKVVQIGSTTQTEAATVTYAGWSYNWTTTGNSTRSRTVTYSWSDYSNNATQTETGGARYIVLDSFSDGKSEGSVHEFGAAGGTITARTVSHDYWPNTSGTHIQTVVITGVTTTCTGFTCTTSGSTVTITAASKGTTESAANQATITSTKSGWQTRSYGSCKQAENTVSYSYDTPQMKGIKWSALIPAGGGTATPSIASYNQVRTNTYTSGSSNKTNITSGASISFARAQIVQNTDPEFYNGGNSIYLYDNAGSGKTTLTRITSGYPSGIPNNSNVAYRIQNTGAGPNPNLGGFCHAYAGTSGQTYLWTFDAYVPAGYELQHNYNTLGSGGYFNWRTPSSGTGEWRTYSIEVYFGTSNSSAFFCSLVGTAGSSSSPVTWWIANSKICKISNVSATAPTINTTTGAVTLASRGTTTGATGVVDTYGAILGTITMNGKTGKFVAAPSQQANAVTKIEAAVANTDTSSCHWYVSPGTSSNKIAAAGGTGTVVGNGTCKFTFTSGSTENKGSSGDYKGYTLSFSRTYKISGTTATTSNGFTLNTSTGAVTAGNNTTTSDRKVNITSDLTVTWGSLSNTLSQSRDVYQNKGSVEYIITPSVTSTGALAAAGATKTSTITYTTKWNGVTTATGTALSGYTIEETADKLSIVSASGTTGTVTITSSNNKSTTGGSTNGAFTYTIKKSGYTPATISGYVSAGSKVYGDPSVTFSYATFAAGGATITPTLSYSQTWTWNGVANSGGTVTSGATNIAYSMTTKTGFTLNSTSTGSITAANNTSTSERSTTASVSFTLNGKTGSKTTTVKQSGGTRYFRVKSVTATSTTLSDIYNGYESIYVTMQTTVSGSTPGISNTWSDIKGSEVASYTSGNSVLGMYVYVNTTGSYNSNSFVHVGTPSLLNASSGKYYPTASSAGVTRPSMSAEAKWMVNFTWDDALTDYDTTNTICVQWQDVNNYGYNGSGKNYVQVTRNAKQNNGIPIYLYGYNSAVTDLNYQLAGRCIVKYSDPYSGGPEHSVDFNERGWCNPSYSSYGLTTQLSDYPFEVAMVAGEPIGLVTVEIYGDISNTLSSIQYNGCDMHIEIVDTSSTSYGGNTLFTSSAQTISSNYNPLRYGQRTCQFQVSGWIPAYANLEIRICLVFSDK